MRRAGGGAVDVVFVVVNSAPTGFLLGPATGVGNLGLSSDFTTDDVGASGSPIRIETGQGTVQQGRTYAEAVGTMSHEYGHVLGLRDLFDTRFLRTVIEFQLPRRGPTELTLFNLAGQRVRNLVNGPVEGGSHRVAWDGRSDQGWRVTSGVYVYRIVWEDRTESRKLLVLR